MCRAQGVSNNYDTDLILPIVLEAARLAGIDYQGADDKAQTALRVIGDHTRAVRVAGDILDVVDSMVQLELSSKTHPRNGSAVW